MWEYNHSYPNELYHYGIKGMKWGVRRFQKKDGSYTDAGKKRRSQDPETTQKIKNSVKNVAAATAAALGVSAAAAATVHAAKNGSHTSVEKKRRGSDASSLSDEELTSKVKRLNLEKQYNKMTKENEPKSKLEQSKKVVDASSELVRQAKNIERDSRPQPVKKKLDLSGMSDQQLRDRINRANLEKQYNDLFGEKETVTISKGRKFAQNALEIGGSALVVTSSVLGIAASIKQILD